MSLDKDMYWFLKYIKSKAGLVYADCDIVRMVVERKEDSLYISNIRVRKTYGYGRADFSSSHWVDYAVEDRKIPFETKYSIFFDRGNLIKLSYIVCDDISVFIKDNKGFNHYVIKPRLVINNIQSYRLNVIHNGDKYSLKNYDIASYLGMAIYRLEKELEQLEGSQDFIMIQENSISGHFELQYGNKIVGSYSSEELNSLSNVYTFSEEGVIYRVYELFDKLGRLPDSCDVLNIDSIKGGFMTANFWKRGSKTILNILGHEPNNVSRKNIGYKIIDKSF